MKKHFIAILLCTLSLGVFAQQTNTRNYIIKKTYKQSGANPEDISKVVTQVQYFDGLGRPIQNVTVGQSPSGQDFVEPIEYDAAGRIIKKYLPYVSGGNGAYQSNALSAAGSWYTANSAGLQATDLGRPYEETTFEPSPLSRVSGQRAPGNKSAASAVKYKVNTASEVKRYDYNPAQNSIAFLGNYAAGTLLRKLFTDEQGNVTNEYTDMLGQLVCRQVIASAQATLSTYYIYDDLGLLRAVLQPNYQDNPSITGNAFTYDYDDRGRMIGKNVPGAGKTEYVFDQYDRLALSRDANQLKRGVWAFTKFDALDRPVITGEINSASTRTDWSVMVDALTQHHEDRNNAIVAGYTLGKTAPKTAVESNVLTVTFYDDYAFSKAAYFAFDNLIVPSFNANVKGQVTGSRVRMLPGNAAQGGFLTNVVYYDAEYRPIQYTRDLYDLGAGRYERRHNTYKYDIAPILHTEEIVHWHSASEGYALAREFTYDHADRLLTVAEQVATPVDVHDGITAAYRYNALGSLQSKWFYNVKDNKYRLRTDHTYNIRGWQTDGKTVYKKDEGGSDKPFFGFGITYANGNNYTNGNISQMHWMKKDDAAFTKGLSFSYDGASRLTGSTGMNGYVNTESGITYDKNGNLKTLVRAGAAPDNLAYAYSANDNRLTSLTDGSGSNLGVKNGASSYAYDDNGNMTTDGNRSAAITYNYLNLPKTVTMNGKTQVYDYDAAGGKHKYVADTLTLKYEGPFEYRQVGANNILYRVSLSEGQAKLKNGLAKFEYYLKDHLGNVRVVFDQSGAIKQQTDYYPFGLSVSGDPAGTTQAVRNGNNRQLYNGKELQVGSGYLDYGARMYMPEVARFSSVDPMAEQGRRWSPYNYAFNNPMRFIDPDGMWPWSVNVRSFAPFREFGGWFKGDNRGYSSASNASARLSQSFTVDPSTHSYSGGQASSSPSSHPLLGNATAKDDRGSISNFNATSNKDGSNTVSFTASMAGHNPIVANFGVPTPDINVNTDFTMTENVKAGTMDVSAVQTGDAFPAAETLIGDTKGNQLFIGVSPANGNPYSSLRGDNNNRAMMSANFRVTMDSKGVFTGVQQGKTTYTIAEWNDMNRQKPTTQP